MKGILVFILQLLLSTAGFSTIWTVTNFGNNFTPSSITITQGDTVNFNITNGHDVVEVSQPTWNANGNNPIPGFSTPFGGGMVFSAQLATGTHWYVCTPHAFLGMKGIITVQACSVPACDDGDLCTIDSCSVGVCINTPVNCDDNDLCTMDSCDAGQCINLVQDCNDGVPCTVDACDSGICTHNDTCCVQQSISLTSGWNMISSYIDPDKPDMMDVLSEISSDILLVKDNLGQAYVPSFGINTIGDWQVEQGYKIKTSNAVTLAIECEQVDPFTTPISLSAGWSTIAYLRITKMDAATALSSIANTIIIVKSGLGSSYIPTLGINTIGDMEPGQGYKIKMSNPATLTYPPN